VVLLGEKFDGASFHAQSLEFGWVVGQLSVNDDLDDIRLDYLGISVVGYDIALSSFQSSALN